MFSLFCGGGFFYYFHKLFIFGFNTPFTKFEYNFLGNKKKLVINDNAFESLFIFKNRKNRKDNAFNLRDLDNKQSSQVGIVEQHLLWV